MSDQFPKAQRISEESFLEYDIQNAEGDDISLAESSASSSLTDTSGFDDEVEAEDAKLDPPYSGLDSDIPHRTYHHEKAPISTLIMVHIHWLVVIVFGYLRHLLLSFGIQENHLAQECGKQKDFVPLYHNFDYLFVWHIYRRLRDCFGRSVCSVPGAQMFIWDRVTDDYCWTYRYPGTKSRILNMGSYNYLGFAQNSGPCAEAAAQSIDKYGVGSCSSLQEFGNNRLHDKLETMVAEYLGTEAALCYPMGFGTNTMNIPSLVGKGSLVLSDELNHASLILGCRLSGATVKVFRHNDVKDLERKLQMAMRGDMHSKRPYSKILIICEGLYSMEGTISHLDQIVELKKKYKAYLFLDEAHSVGSIGPTGRGVVEYWGCKAGDIDILMGTFTKSFSAAGGYIAGKKSLIDHLRCYTHACYSSTLSPPVAMQVIASMHVLLGNDGSDDGALRLQRLHRNTRYFRGKLKEAGFLVYGNEDSPIVPCLLYYPSKVAYFSRALLQRNIGVVIVGFPATPIATERARFCMSAGHTKEQLDTVVPSTGATSATGAISATPFSKR